MPLIARWAVALLALSLEPCGVVRLLFRAAKSGLAVSRGEIGVLSVGSAWGVVEDIGAVCGVG